MTLKAAFATAADVGRRWLETLEADAPVAFPALPGLAVRAPPARDPPVLLPPRALRRRTGEGPEVNEQGSVAAPHLNNRRSQDRLLLHGEELVGAKQNRILNTTVLV